MQLFSIIKDSDIFENPTPEPLEYTIRPTAKGFVFDSDGNIALLAIREGYGLPGGGVETGETFEEAFVRECQEEIGCDVEIISIIGSAEQYRAKDAKKYMFVYFVAKVVGEKGTPTTSQNDEHGIEIVWFSKEKTKDVLEKQLQEIPESEYVRWFNFRTHLSAFKKFLEMK